LSMKEIAQVMEVSEPRISQIHSRAIQKLKLYMKRYMNGEP
ncbi:MAG: FliA/WhiG family RNA polymerase sigma factor, partial [Oscillospiraceae bacterium]|nr:FliA/WhiG family RNA polymerase sigma factor [Oscillospiraceae bacterium]